MSRLTKAWRGTRFYQRCVARRLPGLVVIGGQKCGTSALFKYLAQHPQFLPSVEKEVEFFSSDLRYSRGIEWYTNHWPLSPARAIRFEASPAYMISKKAAERIHRWLPDGKLVALLRDPIVRAFSAWQMYRQQLREDPDFYRNLIAVRYTPEEGACFVRRTLDELDDFSLAIERESACIERGASMEWSVLELGLYGPQLARYRNYFPQEQLLVLDSNNLRTRREETLNEVLRFLGLDEFDWKGADLGDVFVGPWGEPMSARAHDMLRDYYRESNRMLGDMLAEPPAFVQESRGQRKSA